MKISEIPFTELDSSVIVRELTKKPISVVTAHAEMVFCALNKFSYRKPMLKANIITADGVGLIWGLNLLGVNRKKQSGVDIVEKILSQSEPMKIFLFGGTEQVVQRASIKMRALGASVVGYSSGYEYSEKTVFEAISKARPQVVLVGMGGSEKQLVLVNEIRDKLNVSAVTVGGVIDLYAGESKRAPRVLQTLGLEWFWRILWSPSRIRKVPSLMGFTWNVIKERWL